MEVLNKHSKENNKFSCKYLVASALLVLFYSCTKPNLPESKNTYKGTETLLLPSLLKDSSLSTNSGLVCNINDVGSIANWYIKAGKYNEAIDLLLSAKDSLLQINNDTINPYLWTIYDNLWNVYNCVKDRKSSIKYYEKSIEMAKLSWNTRSLLFRLNNLSTTYLNEKEYDKAIPLLTEAYSLLENNSETLGKETYLIYLISLNLSNSYVWIGDFISAKPYFLRAKYIVEHNAFSFYEIWSILTSEADFAIYEKDYKKAFSLYEQSLDLYNKNWDIDWEEWVLQSMKNLSVSLNDYSLAYNYQTKEFEVTKQIISNENENKRAEIESKYWLSEKQRKIDNQQAEIKLQKQWNKFAWISAGFAALIAGVIWFSLRDNKKKKKIIEQKNQELERANQEITAGKAELHTAYEELRATNDELLEKNEIINETNKELAKANEHITKSINYASKIQNHFLYNNIDIKRQFWEHSFSFYKPKDIVSGDFYFCTDYPSLLWKQQPGSPKKVLIVGDCTWHGVPGALLSMLSQSNIKQFLECAKNPSDIINSLDYFFKKSNTSTVPGESLKSTSKHYRYKHAEAHNASQDVKDAIDIECIFYDPNSRLLEYSISSRPIIVLRKWEIIKLSSPARWEVWSLYKDPDFSYLTHNFQLEPEDEVFLFSDGASDQFQVDTGKRLWSKRFQKVLQEIVKLPLSEREIFFENYYETIIGPQENQTDDILIVWFKVS